MMQIKVIVPFLFLFFLAAPSLSWAQASPSPSLQRESRPPAQHLAPEATRSFRFGLRTGFTISSFVGEKINATQQKNRVALTVGGYLNYRIDATFSLLSEIYYSMEGAQFKAGNGGSINTSYLRLPLLAQIQIKDTPSLGIHLLGGASFGILLSAEVKGSGQNIDIKETTNDFDYGVLFGGEINLPMTKGDLNLGVRYYRGLADTDETPNGSIQNTVFSILIGFGF